MQRAPECMRGGRIGSRRAPETEIDPPWKQRLERAELLGHDERCVIGQHDAAGADSDHLRAGGDVRDDDRGCRAGDAWHVVVFGQPVTGETQPLGMTRKIERVCQRRRGIAAFGDRREVEDGESNHVGT